MSLAHAPLMRLGQAALGLRDTLEALNIARPVQAKTRLRHRRRIIGVILEEEVSIS